MRLPQAVRSYARFRGRSGRGAMWLWLIFLGIVAGLFWLAATITGVSLMAPPPWLRMAMMIVAALLLIPSLAIVVRRLHDFGWSGFTVLVLPFPLLVGGAMALFLPAIGLPIMGLLAILCGLFVLMLLFHDSERGENDYGPDPKRRATAI